MRDFWNARAREDPYYFVDNRRGYRDTDLDEFWAAGERDLDQLLSMVEVVVGPDDVILDIGCGVGRLTRALAARSHEVYALDVSSEMLETARAHNSELGNVHWTLGDGLSLRPIPDQSIDGCLSHVVFQHIPDPNITLGYVREMGRVLKPGGWAAFQISNDPSVHDPRRWRRGFRERLAALLGSGPRGSDDPAWLGSAIELEQLRQAALERELSLERVLGAGTQFCVVLARRSTEDDPT